MKKTLLVFAMALLVQQAGAQYFQSTFGAAATIESNAQFVRSTAPGAGYVMAGNHVTAYPGAPKAVHVVRSDNTGAIPGLPYFNQTYTLVNWLTALPYETNTTSVAEHNWGVGLYRYYVAGDLAYNVATNDYDIYILSLNATGGFVWFLQYDMPNFAFFDPKIKMDATNTNLLVTGRCVDNLHPSQQQDIFAMSITVGGTVNWFQTYDLIMPGTGSMDDVGLDIIDNPYTPGQCLVVGSCGLDGLLLTLNSVNGNPLGAMTYNVGGREHQLTSIRTSGNPMLANAFCVSGNVKTQGLFTPWQEDAWTMLLDQTGLVAWSTTHDYSGLPNSPNSANEIMERFNTFTGFHEYYTSGTLTNPGPITDMYALKLNNFGMPMAAGSEFVYGTPADDETGNSVQISNTGGFTLSGTTSFNTGQQLLINSYFNGVTACAYTVNTPISAAATPFNNYPLINNYSDSRVTQIAYLINSLGQATLCLLPVVTGGSNMREAPVSKEPKEDDGFNFTVLGSGEQGVSTGSDLHIAVQNAATGALTARIVDLLGREYACKMNDDGNGHYSISSNIASTGTYYIVLSDGKESKSKALFIK